MANLLTVQAQLQGDASSLVSALKDASKALAEFKETAEAANDAMGAVGAGGGGGGGVVKGLGGGISGLAGAAVGLTAKLAKLAVGTALAGGAVATAFAGAGMKAGLQRLMDIQDATVSLERMLGSAEAAADLTAKALEVVKGTPFAFPDFAQATRTLVAYGVQAEKVPAVLTAIADSAAASGEGAEAVAGLTGAFAKLQVQGKLSSDILESFGTAGVNGLALVANHFGISTEEAQKMISDGLVPAGEAMDILTKGIEEGSHGIAGDFNGLAGAGKALGATISGSLGNVRAAFARMGASWLKPFEKDFPAVLNDGVIPLLDTLGARGKEMFQKIADSGILQKLTDGLKDLQKYVDPVFDTIEHVGERLIDIFSKVQVQVESATWFEPLARSLKSLPDAIDPALDGFEKLLFGLSPLGAVIQALMLALPEIGPPLKEAGEVVLTKVVPALADLMVALVPLLPAIADVVGALAEGLAVVAPIVAGVVKDLVPIVTGLAHAFADAPDPIKAAVVALLLLSKVGVPVEGALKTVGVSMMSIARDKAPALAAELGNVKSLMMGPWGVAFAAAAGALMVFQGWIESTRASASEMENSLRNATTGTQILKTASQGWELVDRFEEGTSSAKKFAENLRLIAEDPWAKGWSLEAQQVESNLGRVGESLASLAQENLPEAQEAFRLLGEKAGGSHKAMLNLLEATPAYQKELEDLANELGVNVTAADGSIDKNKLLALAMGEAGGAAAIAAGQQSENSKTLETLQGKAADAKLGLDTLKSAIQGFGSAALDSREANRQLYESIQTATDTIRENGKATDDSTEAGRENNAALDGIARAAIAAAAATANQTGSQEKATEKMKEGRQAFTDAAIAAGYGADEANRMADELGLIPENVHTAFTVSIDWDQVNAYVKKLNDIPAFKSTVINQVVKTTGAPHGQVGAAYNGMAQANGGIVRAFANGGIPRQPMIARGGANILWAEPETGWEAYISGKPGHERDNANVWLEAGQRLGLLGDGGGGGTNITITVQGGGDPAVWMDELVSKLRFAMGD